MLRRKAMASLTAWREHKTKQALLVTGARQVGKTFLVRAFGQSAYDGLAEINLVENQQALASFRRATSAEDLALRLSIAAPVPLAPGKTLVFVDEIQEWPEFVTYVKFLVESTGLDFVLSGSLLGVELENITSVPVGYLSQVRMFPLDFEEFCWANGLSGQAVDEARAAVFAQAEVPDYLHDRLLALFHRYLLVGGMPDAVATFAEVGNIDRVRAIQDGIIAFYETDITKYAPKRRRLVIKDIFNLIPSELSAQNKRFNFSSIPKVQRHAQVQEDFLWLTQANVALPAYNVHAPVSPLLLNQDRSRFKLFLNDVGLLTSRYPKSASLGLLDGLPAMNMGGVYENFVAQELTAHGFDLRYHTSRAVGELDFVIEDRAGAVTAIEVKSGRSYRTHAALTHALAVPEYTIDHTYVLAETNVFTDGPVTYLPAYAAAFLENA
jgi:predicted AAA+ superfamily ATPase